MSAEIWSRLEATPELLDAISLERGSDLGIQKRLRDRFDADLVRLGLSLVKLREKARSKFTRADSMWFDAVRLEQATHETVASHKASRFEGNVYDLCCGLGADAIALANNCDVTAVDLDDVCEFLLSKNAAAYDVADRVSFRSGNAESMPIDQLIHIDPDRRTAGSRVRRLEQYQPGLEYLQKLTQQGRGGAIKVSAAANFGGKFSNCEIELVSLGGECKEATIWFGELVSGPPWRATHLPSGETIAGDPLDAVADVVPPRRFLFDPDPAIVRSGLVDVYCEAHNLARLDAAEEYLTGESVPDSQFVKPFAFLAETANNDKQIRKMLKAHDVGPLEVKIRHIPCDANLLQKKFTGDGDRPAVLLIARLEGKTRAVLTERI